MSEASPSTEKTDEHSRETAGGTAHEAAEQPLHDVADENPGETAGEDARTSSSRSASGAGARETIVELGERARAVVEELARHARERRQAAEQAAAQTPRRPHESALEESASQAATGNPELLPQQLGALRACVVEVSDVLEATIERLETVESQLGDPDASIEKDLADGIARCERVLMGIEHRVDGASALLAPTLHSPVFASAAGRTGSVLRVLVMARSSRRRADLCIAIERQGLCAVAAHDLGMALRAASRSMPDVALLDLEGTQGERVRALEEWTDYLESGALPRVAVLGAGEAAAGSGIEVIDERHGEAAMAAVLVHLARASASESEIDKADLPRSE